MNYTRTTVFSVFTGRCRELASDSKGAALAITLAFVMPVYLLVIGIYGIGEIVRNKIELQNAADAAAYSASVVQADYLSRIATVNKAMAWTYVDLQKRSLDLAMAVFSEYVFTQFQKDLNNARQRNTPCCMHVPGVHYNCGTDILVLNPVLWLSGTGAGIPELAREFNGQGMLTRFLLPLCAVLFAFALVGTVGEQTPLPRLTACARSVFLWGLGVVCTVTTACFALQTAVTAAADSMAMRGAKYAISGLIPMVGSTVSGSLSTLAAGLSYVKGTVGALSLGAVAYIMLPPLLRLLLFRGALSVGGGICGALGEKERFFAPFRAALDTLIAVYVSALLLYGAQILLFLQCGVTVG